ncbi:MAG: hypothetical protein ACI3YK_02325 [Eubacteriales bacterium]
MKQIIVASVLILLLFAGSIGCDLYLSHECSELTEILCREEQTGSDSEISRHWGDFSRIAAVFTGNDLIRSANNSYETYLTARQDDPESVDTKTARAQLIQALEEIRMIHSFRWERLL